MTFRYQVLADEIIEQINNGAYQAGDRLPGVRTVSRRRQLSVATVVTAYRLLEDSGYLEARKRSGYYVKRRADPGRVDFDGHALTQTPVPITGQQMALTVTKSAGKPGMVQLGAAVPDPSFLPESALIKATRAVLTNQRSRIAGYEMPPGCPELRRQVSLRLASIGTATTPDQVIITSGCQEALRLALRAITEPGDAVAIESPTFYGALQVLEALRLKAVEIPTDPREGMSPEALSLALNSWSIKAVVVVPNNQNPLGFTMSETRKRQLVAVARDHGVTLIEDDIYGDLSFTGERPKPIQALCPHDDVIYCSSYSKTISPGLRVGWVVGGRHHDHIEYLKYVSNVATGSMDQLVLAQYLATGGYERYLRSVQGLYRRCVDRMTEALMSSFQFEAAVTSPNGGYVIWVQLPEIVDTFPLAKTLWEKNISIAPGAIFSASAKYRNFLRISCACKWDQATQRAIYVLSDHINRLLG